MTAGAFLTLGPNINNETATCQITDITSITGVNVTPVLYDFDSGTAMTYWTSNIATEQHLVTKAGVSLDGASSATLITGTLGAGSLNNTGSFSGGGASDSSGQTVILEALRTQTMIEVHGGMASSTNVEMFIPIPWAAPEPYSIRNVPQTSIWLRLMAPSMPFNLSTLVFTVNGVDVTAQLHITQITGGMELLYTPSVIFSLNSRVYVTLNVSCSASIYCYFARDSAIGAEYITISGGNITSFQAGSLLTLGPNATGATELNTLAYVADAGLGLLKVANPTTHTFTLDNLVTYTHDDYPVELSYYFDIVDDFRPPTFSNIYPYNGMTNVPRNQWIMFDIMDQGMGVDISTLSFTIDNEIVFPKIYEYSPNWYRAVYTPAKPYYYNNTISCFATVEDLSDNKNRAFVTWSFKTAAGELPLLKNPNPNFCAFPVGLKSHIELDLFARAAGANLESMIFTWNGKEYEVITYPKIYRPHPEEE